MEPPHVVSFAYGSNMLTRRIIARCPSARALGRAELRGYELRWHKVSVDGSGKCDIIRTAAPDAVVLGVLYEIASNEKPALDRAEGKGSGYEEAEVEVWYKGLLISAVAYHATNTDPTRKPYTWYRALVAAGAREHGFPVSYVAQLEASPAEVDANIKRHKDRTALIAKVQP